MSETIAFPTEKVESLSIEEISCMPLPQSVWCTFPGDLLRKLSEQQKWEMYKRIQRIINEYSKIAPNSR